MASGKRASMREGPLAALFRKTETEGLEEHRAVAAGPPPPEPPAEPARPAPPEPAAPAEHRVPTPQERLRHAFSSDLPENMMAPPSVPPPGPADYQWSSVPESTPGRPMLRVIGVGGGGVNAVNRMIEAEIPGVEFLAFNTDAQSLQSSDAHVKLQLGADITRGLGSGSNPDKGRAAAMEDSDRIKTILRGADMVFITAGEG